MGNEAACRTSSWQTLGREMEEAQTLDLNKGAEHLLQGLISISIIQFNREKAILATVPSDYDILFTEEKQLGLENDKTFPGIFK